MKRDSERMGVGRGGGGGGGELKLERMETWERGYSESLRDVLKEKGENNNGEGSNHESGERTRTGTYEGDFLCAQGSGQKRHNRPAPAK